MTFALKNASVTYQRVMDLIFHDLIGVTTEIYIDDIVIKSAANTSLLVDLHLTFERKHQYSLKIDPLKYAFGVSARKFFGLIIHDKGIEIDPKKIETVKKVRNLHAKGICRNF
jgi:hypothetical protein